ncbi:XRE family transcriptional regulator [Brevibacillus sp. SYSU BS000544]|uniref:XRE family transcriptional regulator n=1 Tax=Brevibacillus sp. SYSU BS000544 TaxID=3416443 RepID=UPI003CE5B597
MLRKKPISTYGWAIKARLAELQMDQKEFCKRNGIPENRMSDLISGTRPAKKYRKLVDDILFAERRLPKAE